MPLSRFGPHLARHRSLRRQPVVSFSRQYQLDLPTCLRGSRFLCLGRLGLLRKFSASCICCVPCDVRPAAWAIQQHGHRCDADVGDVAVSPIRCRRTSNAYPGRRDFRRNRQLHHDGSSADRNCQCASHCDSWTSGRFLFQSADHQKTMPSRSHIFIF